MLSLAPTLNTYNDRGNRAEAHFEFLYLLFTALTEIATPVKRDDVEVRALEWADDHRDEMNHNFFLSRKEGVMVLGSIYRLGQDGRLLSLERFLLEVKADLGEESPLAWSIRSSIGRSLMGRANRRRESPCFDLCSTGVRPWKVTCALS